MDKEAINILAVLGILIILAGVSLLPEGTMLLSRNGIGTLFIAIGAILFGIVAGAKNEDE